MQTGPLGQHSAGPTARRGVQGTRMRLWGMGNQSQVADLLAWLRSHQQTKAR